MCAEAAIKTEQPKAVEELDPVMREVLRPLLKHYKDETTVELRVCEYGHVITDRRGEGKKKSQDPELNAATIKGLCKSLANIRGLAFHEDDAPKLSCVLPGGHRFECLIGASVQSKISLAIRCKHPFTPSWEQAGVSPRIKEYLKNAILTEKNIIISGATNTGKTTLLNMLLSFLDDNRRVIGVEDTPELHLDRFWDSVGLIAAREAGTGNGMLTWRELYDHLMRATPDEVVFGEISTQNAFAALAALNSGITGFKCTIHAESPYQAIHRKFDQNIAWAGENMPRVPEFLAELVDVVVQIKRCKKGYRKVTDIFEPRNDRYVVQNGEVRL
ncbi:MAG: CpaF family protein [Methylocystaceae bacterium]|nr:CpaF family protein [Methylocystaceae bacterium]